MSITSYFIVIFILCLFGEISSLKNQHNFQLFQSWRHNDNDRNILDRRDYREDRNFRDILPARSRSWDTSDYDSDYYLRDRDWNRERERERERDRDREGPTRVRRSALGREVLNRERMRERMRETERMAELKKKIELHRANKIKKMTWTNLDHNDVDKNTLERFNNLRRPD